LEKKVPDQYRPQILAQLACTGRKWADFMSYDPRIPNQKFQSLIIRFQPDKEEIEKVEAAAIQFLKEVEEMFEIINS
jgi:exodeoxyribonuclease (lambda-induced)